ncbi:MAG TPA: DUF4394 domain-containing protein [Pyrinomonadaceae bacterium]|jgi:hypothetical protein
MFVLFSAAAGTVSAATLYAVNASNELVRFDSAAPGTVSTVGAISGLQPGENILGIDFRPATGQLYALGSASRLYVINKTTGAAVFVAALSTPLSGTSFGVDFNPTVDRLRIVSNTGQNLRVNPNDGATIVDGALNPGTPNVTAAAYTNSFSGATATTLFDIDTTTDSLYAQNPPNAGTLVAVGALGVNATDVNGFDISTGDNTAYAALTVAALTGLYTINTTTGAATSVGLIGLGLTNLRGLAAETGPPAGLTAYGVTIANQLVSFNTARPNTILSTVAISGLQPGENILGIDFRPATGQLYALGSASRLYRIDTAAGAATQVGAAGAFALSGTEFGFDFNPTVDRIRVVSNTGQNLRLNPNDGSLTATDGTLNPGAPNVTAAAYTNSFAGATATTLYDIDSGSDTLYVQNPPNAGTLVAVGALGVNATDANGFDIAAGSNTALAALQVNGETASKLFSIDLSTGAASFIAPVGGGVALRGFAIRSGSAASGRTALDFDGDGKTDYAVFRLSNNTQYINRSSDNMFYGYPFGTPTDVQVPGDYDGDGRADTAVWRPENGVWYVLRSSDGAVQYYLFGQAGDEPVARDYDGDGRTDFAVVRRRDGLMIWYINLSATNTFRVEVFGADSDATAPGDYDGDGRFDLGTFRDGTFYVFQSTRGYGVVQWGESGDLVVPGDYDGDGKTDFAVIRQGTNYTWYIRRSSDGGFSAPQLGNKPDVPAQGDYDGDGKTDVAVWRQETGAYYVLRSSTATFSVTQFGQNGDFPLAAYDTH